MVHKILKKMQLLFNASKCRISALLGGSWISLSTRIDIHPGGHVEIGRGVRVMQNSILVVHADAVLELQDGCWIGPGVVIYCAEHISIGEKTRISHYCSILDHNYDIHSGGGWFEKPKITYPIIIGSYVWVGCYALLLKGASIGDRSIIGAQTMLRKSIPSDSLVYGFSNCHLTVNTL